MVKKLYRRRDIVALGQVYADHVGAMTSEGLDAKSAIAAELAFRDVHIAELQALAATLRDQRNTAEDALRAAGFTLVGGAWVKSVPDEFTEWPGRDGVPPDGEWRYIYVGGSMVGRFRVGVRGSVIFDAGSGGIYGAADFDPGERFVRVS